MSRTACDGRTVAARWLALFFIAQKSNSSGDISEFSRMIVSGTTI
jgi:hypothetical protein